MYRTIVSVVLPFVRLLRPKDWIKNVFLFAPLFFTPSLLHFSECWRVFVGTVIFSITASSIYVLNDWQDCDADRLHPVKQYRPIASGAVSVWMARWIFIGLSLLGLISAAFLSEPFFWVVLIYYVMNIAYSLGLKNIAIVDIYCLSAGFILRIFAGAKLVDVTLSVWIVLCTGLLALFLALAKRRDDVVHRVDKEHRKSIRGYNTAFIDTSIAVALSALLIAYTFYTTLTMAELHLGTKHFYYTVPLVLFGILRYLQITLVEECSGSPTALLYKDKTLLCVVLAWIITSAILMY